MNALVTPFVNPRLGQVLGSQVFAGPPPPTSKYLEPCVRMGGLPVLAKRPAGAPSILEEIKEHPIKLILHQHQAPGDIVMMTAMVRDLHLAYPGKFQTAVRTPCLDLWDSNPHVTDIGDTALGVLHHWCEYPLIHTCNGGAHHFVHGFVQHLEVRLGLRIPVTRMCGDLHLSLAEANWNSQVKDLVGDDRPYWLVDAGTKSDFTAKGWGHNRYQAVVDSMPETQFVQVGRTCREGSMAHLHKPLAGKNVLNLLDMTSIRQLMRLVYHSAGVLTPVSFPMHLAAAVPMPPGPRKIRPCVVLAGGREPAHWESYTGHVFLNNCGQLPCNHQGGCMKSRVVPLGDGDGKDKEGLCEWPVQEGTETAPRCMRLISVADVVRAINTYTLAGQTKEQLR